MKKLSFLLAILLVVKFSSCNKKTNNTTSPSPPSTSSPTTLAPDSFNGFFTSELVYTVSTAATSTLNYNNAFAVVTNSLITNFMIPISGPFVNLDTVWLNGNKLNKGTMSNPNENIYTDGNFNFVSGPYAWRTLGGSMTAITYTNTNTYCNFTGYSSWTDTISKSNGLSISLAGVTNATEAWIYLSNNPGPITSNANVLLGSSTSYSFSPTSLSALSTASNGVITVSFYKNNIQAIGGKKINFRNVTTFIKYVGVKN